MSERNIIVENLNQTYIEDVEVEIVERKGIGHPDSISDGLAQAVSNALCDMYDEEVGVVLHHNTDEVQITAGAASPVFGGGKIIKPTEILLTGRAIKEYNGKQLPVEAVAIKAAKEFLKDTIINMDVENDVIVEAKIGKGSQDLVDVHDRNREMPSSNDTSFGVGYAPYSETELLVLKTEELLNSKDFKAKYPGVGEDIKVMGLRENDDISLTIACAMVSKNLTNKDEYIATREALKEEVEALAPTLTKRNVTVFVNTGDDDTKESEEGYYLTMTGTSAENGDDGSVGRGNRANGLITPCRPMSMEATSGKNPINHVGKLYNILSQQIAHAVYDKVDGVKQVNVMLLSQIGIPIDKPKAALTQIILEDGVEMSDVEADVVAVVDEKLANVQEITTLVREGKVRTF